jgi:hypothetical protein
MRGEFHVDGGVVTAARFERPAFRAGVRCPAPLELRSEGWALESLWRQFEYLVADRWSDHVEFTTFAYKAAVRLHFREMTIDTRSESVSLSYCTWTAEFKSTKPAHDLVAFCADELSREVQIRDFEEEDLARDELTNCVSFAIRGGMMLGDIDPTLFLGACAAAIDGVRSRSESTGRSSLSSDLASRPTAEHMLPRQAPPHHVPASPPASPLARQPPEIAYHRHHPPPTGRSTPSPFSNTYV